MIVQPTIRPTSQTRSRLQFLVVQVHVNLAVPQLQLHRLHKPRRVDAENLPVQLTILHPEIVASSPPQASLTRYKPGIHFFREPGGQGWIRRL